MDKILQRTKYLRRATTRRLERTKKTKLDDENFERRQVNVRRNRVILGAQKSARQNRKIDWDAGLLAPRRDVGEKAKSFGAFDMYNTFPATAKPEDRPRWVPVAAGDRVVVVRGKEKGRIGIISEVDTEHAGVKISGMNEVDVVLPEWLVQEHQEDATGSKVTSVPLAIPFDDVKLVYALPHPQTGVPRDVIIDRLTCINRQFDIHKREWDEGDRLIPGTNTIIPWPPKGETKFEEHGDDTLRMSVEQETFKHTLIYPPMPLSIIDELRNKYSKFRVNHSYDYIAKKEMEAARVNDRKNLSKTMQTPLQELAELRQREKKTPELTTDQLAKIGEIIVHERGKFTNTISKS